ncbi:enoyl-CoA hydratase [Marinobacter sp. X15-166B]|uniref:enoyl-CoA hydratase n=1 Tax=Marinobacter sp. X15-166B TaxID=1897620 RepID=UPI00085C424F|nr:enoyl-CoA hydratase [Marinobacter sp. X15-166B]OEY67012.1 enoyl-CoA hydratase [Marinobacter sp. X15-166B]
MNDHILTQQQNQTLVVRLNRLERKNALTHDMYTRLGDALEQAHANDDIRCILFTGDASCFTAGNDLGDFAAGLDGDFESTPVGRFLSLLAKATKPIVAAVNGAAVGVGTTMLLHCDLVYAGDNTGFQMPFVNLGLSPEAGSSLLLPMWFGRVRAAEMLLLGGTFSAEDALRLGLINQICSPEETEARALAACERLCAQPAAAVRATKQLLNRGSHQQLQDSMREEGRVFLERLKSPEVAEALAAFLEKRTPDFSKFS